MDEKPDQIMSHIESQRDQLGRNLNELESRVKSATDWRVQFDKNPMLMMGVALGGGILLGSIVGGSRKNSSNRSSWSSSSRYYPGAGSNTGSSSYGTGSSNLSSAGSSSSSATSPAVRENRKKATDTLEHMKAALIGFATAKVKEFMSEALPGFNQHLEDAERKNTQGRSGYEGSGSGSYGTESSSQSYGSGQTSGTGQASTRTEHSANSPYAQQGAGQNVGLGV
ncbi:MAG TPA: hypothetical protein VER03_11815 [Bryobacteraceae bacterium]|nr:hypothetical protein [Bryobacteraceae bacterium]